MRISDWSSDVCSSDLVAARTPREVKWIVIRSRRVCAVAAIGFDQCRLWPGRLALTDDHHGNHGAVGAPRQFLSDAQLGGLAPRSEEHTSELQSLMRTSYAVFCLKKKNNTQVIHIQHIHNTNH